jgi:predicted PurR-regulated permease PerM
MSGAQPAPTSPEPEATPEDADQRRMTPRAWFLWISAAAAITVLLVSSEVLVPFVMALLVAYVLTPLVVRVERRGVARWAAILLVYAVTLGGIVGSIAIIVPSVAGEVSALQGELPKHVERAKATWIPAIDARLRAWSHAAPRSASTAPDAAPTADPAPSASAAPSASSLPTQSPPTQSLPAQSLPAQSPPAQSPPAQSPPAQSPPAPSRPDPAITVRPTGDGGFEVAVNERVQLRKTGDDTYRVELVPDAAALEDAPLFERLTTRATTYVGEHSGDLLRAGQAIVVGISRGIFNLFMTLMLGGYIILTHERILEFFRELVAPGSRSAFDRLLRRLDRGLSGVVRGQLLICLVNGVLSAIGFWIFGLKYWPLMSILAAVGSLIPIFGSILSAIPAVLVGLTQSPGTAFAVLAWILGIHQLEANFLNPKIIGDSAKIHPVLVVFALLVGEHFFQIKGALFAVPCMSIAQTIFLHFRESTLGLADPMATRYPSVAPPGSASPKIPPPPRVPGLHTPPEA